MIIIENKKHYNVGYVAGMFDIIHIGHIEILKRAKAQCEKLIVAVGTDDFVAWRKGHKPVFSFDDRTEIVKAIRYVDEVVPATDLDKIAAYRKYQFNVMFAGDDHKFEEVYLSAAKELKEYNVDTIFISRLPGISSTIIKDKISS